MFASLWVELGVLITYRLTSIKQKQSENSFVKILRGRKRSFMQAFEVLAPVSLEDHILCLFLTVPCIPCSVSHLRETDWYKETKKQDMVMNALGS